MWFDGFAWPQNDKLEYDSIIANNKNMYQPPYKYEYTPKSKTIIVADVKKPKKAALLHRGEKIYFDYKEKRLTIVIPAEKRTKLVDVVRVDF